MKQLDNGVSFEMDISPHVSNEFHIELIICINNQTYTYYATKTRLALHQCLSDTIRNEDGEIVEQPGILEQSLSRINIHKQDTNCSQTLHRTLSSLGFSQKSSKKKKSD